MLWNYIDIRIPSRNLWTPSLCILHCKNLIRPKPWPIRVLDWLKTMEWTVCNGVRTLSRTGTKVLKGAESTSGPQLMTRRSEVQVLSPQPIIRWNRMISADYFLGFNMFPWAFFLLMFMEPFSYLYGKQKWPEGKRALPGGNTSKRRMYFCWQM